MRQSYLRSWINRRPGSLQKPTLSWFSTIITITITITTIIITTTLSIRAMGIRRMNMGEWSSHRAIAGTTIIIIITIITITVFIRVATGRLAKRLV